MDLVAPGQVRQIAGRAGRHKSMFPDGEATVLHNEDNDYFKFSMSRTDEPIKTMGIFQAWNSWSYLQTSSKPTR